jgi:uncharacterized protein YndB with AHSA1/START domain
MEPISRSRTIAAPPNAIFDVLADPRRHAEIDGSGTIVEARADGPDTLEMGSKFGMRMKWGLPYSIKNTVVEYDENKLIAWCHPGGHRWRYELESVDGGTKVTETFDPTTSKAVWALKLMKIDQKHGPNIERTLAQLDEVATADPG